ncbi:MAG: hypothetical protein ACXU8N_21835 [Telluria sp.]
MEEGKKPLGLVDMAVIQANHAHMEQRIARVEADLGEIKSSLASLREEFAAFRGEVASMFSAFRAEVSDRLNRAINWAAASAIAVVLAMCGSQAAIIYFLSNRIDNVRTELRTEIRDNTAQLRAEIRANNAELRAEMRDMRAEMRDMRSELRSELRQTIAEEVPRAVDAALDRRANAGRRPPPDRAAR